MNYYIKKLKFTFGYPKMKRKLELEYNILMELYHATGIFYTSIDQYATEFNNPNTRLTTKQKLKVADILNKYQHELIKLYIIKPRFNFLKEFYLNRLNEKDYLKLLQLVMTIQGGLLELEQELRTKIVNEIVSRGFSTLEEFATFLSTTDTNKMTELDARVKAYINEGRYKYTNRITKEVINK